MPVPRPRLPRLSPSRRGRAGATPPQTLLSSLPRGTRLLGALPVGTDGTCWLLSTPAALLTVSTSVDEALPLPGRLPWDRLSRASWQAEERLLTLRLLGEAADRQLWVPPVLRYEVGGDAEGTLEQVREVDEAPLLRSLRERVEAAIIHHVSTTLPSGVRLTASVRRSEDGRLYTALEPSAHADGVAGHSAEVEALLRRVRDGVGLPTHADSPDIPPLS